MDSCVCVLRAVQDKAVVTVNGTSGIAAPL